MHSARFPNQEAPSDLRDAKIRSHARQNGLAVPVFEKVGMRLVGAWTPVAGDYTNALSYMLAWESLNEREEKWQDFFNHPDWLAGREDVGKKHGAIVSREFHTFLGPTSYSPLQ